MFIDTRDVRTASNNNTQCSVNTGMKVIILASLPVAATACVNVTMTGNYATKDYTQHDMP